MPNPPPHPPVFRKNLAIKHIDGDPLTRQDIQFDLLHEIFTNPLPAFTDPNSTTLTGDPSRSKVTFRDLYINVLVNSPRCSKGLRDKIVQNEVFGDAFAKVALLANVGRINTTMAFFPELRTSLRTYHPVPSLQQSSEGNLNLQDAPRIKNILKSCFLEGESATNGPSTPLDVLARARSGQLPPTSLINLIFVLSNHSLTIGRTHLPPGPPSEESEPERDFHTLFLPSSLSSHSRARSFLWLCHHYYESTTPNPFADDYSNDHPDKSPLLLDVVDSDENVDPPEEVEWGRKMTEFRREFLRKIVAGETDVNAEGSTQQGEGESQPKKRKRVRKPKPKKGDAKVVALSVIGSGDVGGMLVPETEGDGDGDVDMKADSESIADELHAKTEEDAGFIPYAYPSYSMERTTLPSLPTPSIPTSTPIPTPTPTPVPQSHPPTPSSRPRSSVHSRLISPQPARISPLTRRPLYRHNQTDPYPSRPHPYRRPSISDSHPNTNGYLGDGARVNGSLPPPTGRHRQSSRSSAPPPIVLYNKTMLQHTWHTISTMDAYDSDEEKPYPDESLRVDYLRRLRVLNRLRGKEPTPEPADPPLPNNRQTPNHSNHSTHSHTPTHNLTPINTHAAPMPIDADSVHRRWR
ncbi:hypothetical protein JAAARDRAFT_65834 [Jaapia argillacea MUCL 33604]|uniref:Ino eighty subunit 1 n=1 Tax=Jaapia argillacea MUCL 33604 TaxID=933084 RepID=A0A067QA35_9AGAM|nr:hypothetical protein JAAARDRAFT_65834 [Jaapia argillacea MUCL 33604]